MHESALVDYAAGTRPEALPPAALAAARVILLDTLGAMLGACAPRYSTARLIVQYARAEGGLPWASIVGHDFQTGPALAGLTNGTLAYALDIESIHGPSITHAASVVVPAALAIAEAAGRSGAELLTAVVVGLDAADRISRAISPRAFYARGFHPSAVGGAPAAALAAANLLRLDPPTTRRALGLAATQASGLMGWETDPTENSRPFNCGVAARNGITAAMLAHAGFGGPDSALQGSGGLLEAFGDAQSDSRMLDDGLGERFAVDETQLKRFACCAFLQPGVEALVELRRTRRLAPADVEHVDLHFPRGGAAIIDGNPLRSHCAQYVLAVALASGNVTFDDLARDRRRDEPDLAALAERVRVVHSAELDPEFPDRYTSRVVCTLRDGQSIDSTVTFPAGHPRNPLSSAELHAKFRHLATEVVNEDTAADIITSVARLESSASIESLMRLLRCPRRPDE